MSIFPLQVIVKLSKTILIITTMFMVMILAALNMGRAWRPPVFVMISDEDDSTTIIEAGSNSHILATLPFGSMDWRWSTDGRQVAVISHWGRVERLRDIYVYDFDGGSLQNISNHPASDTSPVWSPDDRHIAFVSWRDGNTEIYVTNVDNGDLFNVSSHPASDTSPAWSPDSRMLAFVSERDGDSEIYVMNADGSNLRNLSRRSAQDTSPIWSPDGSMIAFISLTEGQSELWVVDVNTSTLFRLSDSYQGIVGFLWQQPD